MILNIFFSLNSNLTVTQYLTKHWPWTPQAPRFTTVSQTNQFELQLLNAQKLK